MPLIMVIITLSIGSQYAADWPSLETPLDAFSAALYGNVSRMSRSGPSRMYSCSPAGRAAFNAYAVPVMSIVTPCEIDDCMGPRNERPERWAAGTNRANSRKLFTSGCGLRYGAYRSVKSAANCESIALMEEPQNC